MTMFEKAIISEEDMRRALVRIAHEIAERNHGCEDVVLIGMHTRGVPLARRIARGMMEFHHADIPVGTLDISSYRDDLLSFSSQCPRFETHMPVDITGKRVVLVDDVLFTGRSIRAAMDAIIDRGRPQSIELAVFVDRGHRELPIRANYVGKNVPTSRHEEVEVRLKETDGRDEVVIIDTAVSRGKVAS